MRLRQGCNASPRAHSQQGFAVSPCSQHPPACPQGKPSAAHHHGSAPLPSHLHFQTSVFTPRPITELFSLEGLHHCLSPAAYHVSISLYIYIIIFFFPKEGLDAAIFSTLPMCWRQFMLWDTWQRLQKYFLLVLGEASLAKTHEALQRPHSPSTAQHTRQMQYSEFAFDSTQTKSPMETQKAEQGHHILCNIISQAKHSLHAITQGEYDLPAWSLREHTDQNSPDMDLNPKPVPEQAGRSQPPELAPCPALKQCREGNPSTVSLHSCSKYTHFSPI